MKRFVKYTALTMSVLLLTACAQFKTLEVKKVDDLPTTFNNASNNATEEFIPITLNTYFNDPQLLQLFDRVMKSNPDYQIFQQRILIANSHLKRAKLALIPSLDLSINASGTKYGDHTMEGVGNFDTNLSSNIQEDQKIKRDVTPNYWLGFQTSWEIDVWGRLRHKKRAAQQRFLASQQGINLLKNQLFTDVADLYYQLIALDKKVKIYEANYGVQLKAFEIVESQRAAGKATELAVQQFGAQSKNMQAEMEQLKIEINSTEKALLSLLGEYSGDLTRGTTFLSNHLALLNQKIHVDSIIHKRPDVAESYFELVASNADAKSARAAFFPKIQFGGNVALHSFSMPTFFNVGSIAWQLLGGLVQPIFNQGQLKQEFYIANRNQEIAFFSYQKNVINAFNELSSLLSQVAMNQTVLNIKDDEVAFLDRAVDVSNDLYLTGYANYWEIINAQKAKIQAELDYVDFQHRNAKALVQLYKALGGEIK